MINRRDTKKINIGNISIGGDSNITVQSMCNTKTKDTKSTINQIKELEDAGCEIIRVAVPDKESAKALGTIKKAIDIPLVADIHFDYRLALEAIEQGVDALRLNPGNIGRIEFVQKVTNLAKERDIPIRIGINAGSLEKEFQKLDIPLEEKMVMSAKKHIKILEDEDFDKIVVSLKSSDVLTMIKAYRLLAKDNDYPFHLGVTEAGTLKGGLVKSSLGIGSLLLDGIGDTIRVSLTDNPIEEVYAGFEILKALNLRKKGIKFVSCPTCARCNYNLIELAKKVEEKFRNIDKDITLAVMGCPVNGPGEAKNADIGVAGGAGFLYVFKKGEIILKANENNILNILEKEIENL